MHTYRYILTGLGNIGCTFLEMLHAREDLLAERYGLGLQAVGLADSSGVAYDPAGFAIAAVAAHKRARRGVAELPQAQVGWDSVRLMHEATAELLLEATPTNLVDAQPGLAIVRTALTRGMHAVLASKGPLVLGYQELAALSDLANGAPGSAKGKPCLRFSGAVGGGLPSINIGWRDLAGARIRAVEAVLNGTTQVILQLMADGQTFAQALAAAQAMGIVEPDPALDVDGWDAASKLVILANAVLQQPTRLADLHVTGIAEVSSQALAAARAAGGRMSLVGRATLQPDGRYQLSVAPTTLAAEHPLAHLGLGEMGIVYESDNIGRTVAASLEDGPLGSTAAMLRDVIEIVRSVGE